MGEIMPFETFIKRMTPLAKAPSVTIEKRGVISLNKVAHDLVDNAKTVELLYDRARQVIAVCATDDSPPPPAYAVRRGSKRAFDQAIISTPAFTAHYGIDTTTIRRWKPFVEDSMLCVGLTEEGTVITGNRSKAMTPAEAVEPAKAWVENATSEVSTDGPDHPRPTPPPGYREEHHP
ncbi:hypothetical protein [Kocuria sp. U4B]